MSVGTIKRASIVLLATLVLHSMAQAQDEYAGEFVVRDASAELVDGVYRVNADIELNLSAESEDLLRAPVPLTIIIETQFLNRLRFWWDIVEFDRVVRYRLSYLRVRSRYQVRDLDTDMSWNFVDLDEALAFIGRVESLEIIAADELDEDRRYDVRVRAVLDKSDLPGPLRLISFWREDWSIASDWLTWRLDNE